MIDKPMSSGAEQVICAVCEKQVPKSVAVSSEDPDYLLYFCSADCYEQWSADQLAAQVQEAGEP